MKVNNEMIKAVENHKKLEEKINSIEELLNNWANGKSPSDIKIIEYHDVEIRIGSWLTETMIDGVNNALQIKRKELIAEIKAIEIKAGK